MPDKISVTRLEPDAVLVGADVAADKRQRGAIEAFAKTAGYNIVAEFHDAADPVAEREGFAAVLERIAGNGVRTIIVESPDRFARDLTVRLAGRDFLKSIDVTLTAVLSRVPASARLDA